MQEYIGNTKANQKLNQKKKIILGLFVAKKRLKCKKYDNIFAILNCDQIQVIQMWPYFNQHWTKWPIVDVIISFKGGIPFLMIYQYAQKYKPLIINNLQNQQFLWERTSMYDILQELNIPTPKHVRVIKDQDYIKKIYKKNFGKILNQNNQQIKFQDYMKSNPWIPKPLQEHVHINQQKYLQNNIQQHEDFLLMRNNDQQIKIQKPFVQKAFDARDHSVAFYYPQSLGGGRRIIFRQDHGHTNTAQSGYEKNCSNIRNDQNYMYEQFLATNAFDVKVYVIGDFVIAESRRSPIVQVQKMVDKSQIRYQIQLTNEQKQYCSKITKKLGQYICAFDILRSNGISYVCDINGWGFANCQFLKQQIKIYWTLCANLIKNKILQHFIPQKVHSINIKSFDQYVKNHHKQSLVYMDNKKQRQTSLIAIFSIFSVDQNENNQNQLMFKKGQKMRQTRYQNYDCLQMFYSFKHDLNFQSFLQVENNNLCCNFLKGFLRIKGQISPAISCMLKNSKSIVNNIQKDQNKHLETKQQQFIQKIWSQIQNYKLSRNQKSQKMVSSIYFKSSTQLNQIWKIINQKYLSKFISENDKKIQKTHNITNIQFKLIRQNHQTKIQQSNGQQPDVNNLRQFLQNNNKFKCFLTVLFTQKNQKGQIQDCQTYQKIQFSYEFIN